MSDTKLILTYFPIGGRAEAIRLAAAVGSIPFTNKSLAFQEFLAAKNSYPLGQVPVLEIEKDGKESQTITQSSAILRYFGKRAGLYPTDDIQAMRVDEICSVLNDAIAPLAMTVRGAVKCLIGETEWTTEEKMEIRKRWMEKEMPKYLGFLESALKSSTSGWLVGGALTIADLSAFVDLSWIGGGILDGIPTSVLDDYPSCVALMEKVQSVEKVKEWMEKYEKPYGTFDFMP